MKTPQINEQILWNDMFESRKKSKLEGAKIKLDDLAAIFHTEKSKIVVFEGVTELENSGAAYKIYGRPVRYKNTRVGFFERLAYECTNLGCNKIIVGKPLFYDLNDPHGDAGFKGYVVSCTLCNHALDIKITEKSTRGG